MQIVAAGVVYGLGLVLGNLVAQVLFAVLSPDAFGFLGQNLRLLIGVLLVILIMALAGGIGGFGGGWTLPVVGKDRGKYGYARPTAISMAIVYSTFLFLAVFGITLLTRQDVTSAPAIDYVRIFLFVGLIFGLLYGLIQGAKTVGIRRAGSIVLASTLGFTLGGAGLGLGLCLYLNSIPSASFDKGTHAYLLLGLFVFGLLGGITISIAYHRLARMQQTTEQESKPAGKKSLLYYVVVGVIVVALIVLLRPIVGGLIDVITPRQSNILEFIPLNTVGTHWLPLAVGSEAGSTPNSVDLSASHGDTVAIVWSEEGEPSDVLYVTRSSVDEGQEPGWTQPVIVSNSASLSLDPQISMAPYGRAHIVWTEETDGRAGVKYSVCKDGACTEAVLISDSNQVCPSTGGSSDGPQDPALDIAVGGDGTVLVAWSEAASGMQYARNPNPDTGESSELGCIPSPGKSGIGHLVLDDEAAGSFRLAVDDRGVDAGSIWLNQYQDGVWAQTWLELGQGHSPGLEIGPSGDLHVAWCSQEGVTHWHDGEATRVADSACASSPQLGQDSMGRTHILWDSDAVETVLGDRVNRHVLYESIQQADGWSAPAIVANPQGPSDLAMANDSGGVLHMTWTDDTGQSSLQYAFQTQYECDETSLTGAEEVLYRVAREGGYRPEDDIIPFCGNSYQDMVFTPNPDPAFSDKAPTLNGGYDQHAQLVETAEFEVLFTTMAFDEAINHDSPGAVLADSVYKLYQQVLANPEDYPKGMHVRLMLGNSPPIAELELDAQLWHFLKDIREAGFEKMIDPEVGWKLEVANYAGAWPHSHVKVLVIDGKTVVASGFNHEYKPLPEDHPSGQGLGDTDTGLIMTGPVAQHTRVVYEQLWDGAVQRHCDDLSIDNESWQETCQDHPGVPADVPEAMRFYPTEGDAVAFSMYRSHVYDESDQQIIEAFSSASESIDVAQAMYSMPSICILNHFFDVCSYYQALPYMRTLMRAAENGAHLRLLLTPYPSQNIENVIAAEIFLQEAADRGLADRVELRFFDTFLHSKSALIDEEFLIMGSQNLHYSAFSRGDGLSEYNLGTSDPAAIDQYQRMYEFYWDRSEPE